MRDQQRLRDRERLRDQERPGETERDGDTRRDKSSLISHNRARESSRVWTGPLETSTD